MNIEKFKSLTKSFRTQQYPTKTFVDNIRSRHTNFYNSTHRVSTKYMWISTSKYPNIPLISNASSFIEWYDSREIVKFNSGNTVKK